MAADAQKLLDGVAHPIHHQPQFAHLAHGRGAGLWPAKIKLRQRLRLGGNAAQAAPNAPPGHPAHWQQQANQPQQQPHLTAQIAVEVREQFDRRNRHHQLPIAPAGRLQRLHLAEPLFAVDLKAQRFARLHVQLVHGQQTGHAQLAQGSHAEFFALQLQHARHIGVGQHAVFFVQHSDFGARHWAQVANFAPQIGQRHVQPQHGIALGAGLAQGDAQLLRGEEQIRRSQDLRAALLRLCIPRAGARVELVIGAQRRAQQIELRVVKAPAPDQRRTSALLFGDGLDEERSTFGHTLLFAQSRLAQRPHQQKLPIWVADIQRRQQQGVLQQARQHRQTAQALGQSGGSGNRVVRQQPHDGVCRVDDALHALGNQHADALGAVARGRDDGFARTAADLVGHQRGQQQHGQHDDRGGQHL